MVCKCLSLQPLRAVSLWVSPWRMISPGCLRKTWGRHRSQWSQPWSELQQSPWDDEIGRQVLGMVRTLKLPEEPKASSSLEAGAETFRPWGCKDIGLFHYPLLGPRTCGIRGWFFLVEIDLICREMQNNSTFSTDDYPPLKRKFAPETLGLEDEFPFWEGHLRGARLVSGWNHPPIP